VSISVNIEAPAPYIGQPTEGDGYKIVACELLQGVEALSSMPNVSSRNCALLAAHALECALKAFLWHKGKTKKDTSAIRHNLKALWDMACKEGLSIPQTPPDWCVILSSGHGPDYYFRYQEGQRKNIVHGGQTPALMPMAVELRKIIEMVERAIK
jgi:hypothetical protein